MPSYTTKEIQLDELYLDEKNPRFIVPPNPSQQSIVDCHRRKWKETSCLHESPFLII